VIVMGCDGIVGRLLSPNLLCRSARTPEQECQLVGGSVRLNCEAAPLTTDICMASQFLNAVSTGKKYECSLYSGCLLTAARALASRSRRARPTLITAGASSEGAAGSIVESISKLECTIDPNEIVKKAGGGAECKFETGQ
jgi:hypothetical protein